ncbi:probable disease resistance protein At1g52660 isoform X2 [Ricinus communis]|uniref:probable disease resistance protein At1g52660 isoform X2 n=1 Tax=Ricinus communis TaxID=3988 RepID=UPI00201A4E82|nr:probable disease resistance protein At1g52660 isoform X2 [Ricinus communis]
MLKFNGGIDILFSLHQTNFYFCDLPLLKFYQKLEICLVLYFLFFISNLQTMVCPFQVQCGDSLIRQCLKCTAGQGAYICKLEDNLVALQTATEELRELKDDVIQKLSIEEGQRMKRLKQVQGWISRAEAKITEVDELIKEGLPKILNCKSRYIFGRSVAKKLEDVIAMKRKGDFKVVAERAAGEAVVERPSEPTVGLESILNRVWKCLVEEEVGVVGIYGMGGVGKTTILTQINNMFVTSPNDFVAVIWVVVSKDLRLDKVQEEIAKRIGLSDDQQWKNKNFSDKAEDIFRVLHKRKFVLLLDDIWKRLELKEVGVPLPKRQSRSKIVFTARSEAVCSSMEAQKKIKVEPLEWLEAWELFQEKVGGDTLRAHPEIPLIAEAVARKCGGLPLALVTIARAMACRRTLQEWKYAVETLRKSASNLQGMGDEVFPILKFSYDCLPNDTIKSCFLYCALFPEDVKILKDNLIDYWICEDFWDNDDDNQEDALNKGYNIIGTLVHACLLKEEKEGRFVKMHDMIRDMALWVACEVEKKENYLVSAGARLTKAPEMGRWRRVKRISLMDNRIEQLKEVPNCPDLLTLILRCNKNLWMITSDFFQSMNALTVLDLAHTALQVLPTGISELIALQYLNLLGTKLKELPPELTKLKKLKYLNLSWNEHLRNIPGDLIASLPMLQVLRMYRCGIVCNIEEKGDVFRGTHHVTVQELQRT